MADPAQYQPPPNGWRTFLILWATQAFSVFGSMITQFTALAWLAATIYPRPEQRAELSFAIAAVGLADGLPMLFVAPIAGVWSDRYSRKMIMVGSNLASGLLSVVLVLLIVTQSMQVWMLVVILALLNIAHTFQSAAFEPTYVLLVPRKHLTRANGMTTTITSLSNILAPGIATMFLTIPQFVQSGQLPGPLLALLSGVSDGALLAFSIDMITFFVAAIVPLFLYIPLVPSQSGGAKRVVGRPTSGIWAEFRQGLEFILQRRGLFWLLLTFTVTNFAMSITSVLQVLLVRYQISENTRTLGLSFEAALATITTSGAIGGVLGGLLISTWGGFKRRRVYGVLGAMIVAAIALTLLGLSSLLYMAAALMFLIDFVNPVGSSHFRGIWQTQVPPELQGRIVAVIRMIAQSSWPLGVLVAGGLGAVLDAGTAVAVVGGCMTLFMVSQLFNRSILELNEPPSDPPAASANGLEPQAASSERPADVEESEPTGAPVER